MLLRLYGVTPVSKGHHRDPDVTTLGQEDMPMQLYVNSAANDSKTEVQKLNEILETVQKWQNIPQHISQQIENLHDSVMPE